MDTDRAKKELAPHLKSMFQFHLRPDLRCWYIQACQKIPSVLSLDELSFEIGQKEEQNETENCERVEYAFKD